jgi:DNA-directed RNA polymerase specialized sigma24 family protein
MSRQGSISRFLDGLKAGDSAAADALWQRYCGQLIRLARRQLPSPARRVADEEDVALSAFNSLCLGARRNRFPALSDRDSLWRLLVFITRQKSADLIAHTKRLKRGGGKVRGHSALVGKNESASAGSFDQFVDQSPGPATLNIWVEQYKRLLDRLDDEKLKQIAELSVQGHTIEEIAKKLGLARSTIHRKLGLIRKILLRNAPA